MKFNSKSYSLFKFVSQVTSVISLTVFIGCNTPIMNRDIRATQRLTIAPPEGTIPLNSFTNFTISGGVPPYQIQLESGESGSISQISNTQFRFTSTLSTPGFSIVKALDNEGSVARTRILVVGNLAISPKSWAMLPGQTHPFSASASGLTGAMNYSIIGNANGATINAATGLFTAPATTTSISVTVRVTDRLNRSDTAIMTIAPALSLNISSATLKQGATQIYTPSGGTPPYSFTLSNNAIGTLSPENPIIAGGNVTFTAKSLVLQEESAVLTVTDNVNRVARSTINLKPPVVINPPSISILQGVPHPFTASGGNAPYTFSLIGNYGTATINDPQNGVLKTPSALTSSLNFKVRVTDGLGQTSDSEVTVDPVFLAIPPNVTLARSQQQIFTVSGGSPPYSFALNSSSSGTLSIIQGLQTTYTAPSIINTEAISTLTISDSRNRTITVPISLKTGLTISGPPKNLTQNKTYTFTASGGYGNYTFSILGDPHGCSLNQATGVLTTPTTVSENFSITMKVTDGLGQFNEKNVQVKTPLTLTPSQQVIGFNETYSGFLPQGGELPYTYSILSGTVATVTPAGVFSSLSTAGEVRFQVTDNLEQTINGRLIVELPLSITPNPINLQRGERLAFTYSGGIAPYRFSLSPNRGEISPLGLYTAPGDWSGPLRVIVTDSLEATAAAQINIGLVLTPINESIAKDKTRQFQVSGGRSPFTYSTPSNNTIGTINSSSGLFTARATASGETTVTVRDSLGQSDTTNLRVAPNLTISAPKIALKQGEIITLTATGGHSSNTFSIVSGLGSLTAAGVFTAGAVSAKSDTVIKVSNTLDQSAQITVSTYPFPTVSPVSKNLAASQTITFTPAGGKAPYTYSLNSGVGSISGNTYTAPSSISQNTTVNITLQDSLGQSAQAHIYLKSALQLAQVTSPVRGGTTQTLIASGGDGTYTFNITSGAAGGELSPTSPADPTKRIFSAMQNLSSNTSVIIEVKDGLGQMALRTIVVVPPVRLSAASPDWMLPGASQTFTASLGAPPYTFTVLNTGRGGVFTPVTNSPNKQLFTASASQDEKFNIQVSLQVSDNLGQIARSSLTVAVPPKFPMVQYSVLTGNFQEIFADRLSGKHPLTFTNISGNAGNVIVSPSSESSLSGNDSITVVRCTTATLGTPFLPLYPAVDSCPSGQTFVGSIVFSRTTTPIWHVDLGARPGFPQRGRIYTTSLAGEQLGEDELSGVGTYQINYDTLLRELGVTTPNSLYVFTTISTRTGRVTVEAKDALNQKQTLIFDVLPKILPQPTTSPLNHPTGIALNSQGEIFTADSLNNRVVKYSASGSYLSSFGVRGLGAGQLDTPWGIAINRTGSIYVSEQENHRISVFNSNLQYVSSFGSPGSANGQLQYPRGLALDNLGNLYVADTGNHRIQKFSSEGIHLMTLGSMGTEPGKFYEPQFILVRGNILYICDNTRVQKLTLENDTVTQAIVLGRPGTDYIKPGAVTDIFAETVVLDTAQNRLVKLTSNGARTVAVGPAGTNSYGVLNSPISFTVGPLGKLFITDLGRDSVNHRIQVWMPTVSPNTLTQTQRLKPWQFLAPADNRCNCKAVMQYDGNFVVNKDTVNLWNSNTFNNPGSYLLLQGDGNLVVYNGITSKWTPNVANQGGAFLVMRKNCNLELLREDNTVVWQSNTAQTACE